VTNQSIGFQTPPKRGAPIPTRRLVRLTIAAEYLSLSPWKMRRLIQEGRLPVVQDCEGSPFMLDLRDLDVYVDRNKRSSPL
jgi:excisionase family DNA binding protein